MYLARVTSPRRFCDYGTHRNEDGIRFVTCDVDARAAAAAACLSRIPVWPLLLKRFATTINFEKVHSSLRDYVPPIIGGKVFKVTRLAFATLEIKGNMK